MFHKHSVRRTVQLAACGMAMLLCAPGASGEPSSKEGKETSKADKRACKVSYKSAKESEKALRLREANDLYLACAKATCGAFYKQVCTARFAQLQSDIPSIVPVVTDETGATRDDVQVKMDGELLTTRLDGRALPVEPGHHDFSFEVGGLAVSQKILMMEGQRNRPIAISLAKRAPQKNLLAASATTSQPAATNPEPTTSETPAPEKRAPRRPAAETPPPSDETAGPVADEPKPKGGGPGFVPYLIGGTGLAALGTGALFTLWGKKDNDALAACSPNCRPESIDHIRNFYTIADVSIGVGAAALAVSAILFATSSGSSKEASTAKAPPAKAAYMLDLHATRNGAFAGVSGAF